MAVLKKGLGRLRKKVEIQMVLSGLCPGIWRHYVDNCSVETMDYLIGVYLIHTL